MVEMESGDILRVKKIAIVIDGTLQMRKDAKWTITASMVIAALASILTPWLYPLIILPAQHFLSLIPHIIALKKLTKKLRKEAYAVEKLCVGAFTSQL
jgi:hypothetical protein